MRITGVVAAFRGVMMDVELPCRTIGEDVLVYHAFTPPTGKFVRRTGRLGRWR